MREEFERTEMVTFMGVRVCQKAFAMLAGVGASSFLAAKNMASTGHVSAFSRQELLQGMLVKPRNKDPKYIDAREWLEIYADRHAEQSPMTGAFMLPSGRKMLYWLQYEYERYSELGIAARIGTPAAYSTFLLAWRKECPHIVVVKSMTMFTRCGLCDFLQNELAKCPRSETKVVEMLKRRLGQRYEFLSAQRLAMGRIEEQRRRSGGAEWPESLALTRALARHVTLLLPWLACARPPPSPRFMKIDKMDQKKTILPTIWSQPAA